MTTLDINKKDYEENQKLFVNGTASVSSSERVYTSDSTGFSRRAVQCGFGDLSEAHQAPGGLDGFS